MADIVNLRRLRKDKARREREIEAAANRRRFGRTRGQKAADKGADASARRDLAGKLLDRDKP